MKVLKGARQSTYIFIVLFFTFARSSLCEEGRTFVAYSMKEAERRIESALRTREDFRTRSTDVYYLGGITKPWLIVIDEDSKDWILVGEENPDLPILTLDDWIVALRSRYVYPHQDPGVTIDPPEKCRSDTFLRTDCLLRAKQQKVRFFAGVADTHFGKVCFEADWLLKKIALGFDHVSVEIKTFYNLAQEQARARNDEMVVSSRFWFYPIVNRVNVLKDVVLLERFEMGVFSEIMGLEKDGQSLDPSLFSHYPSEEFARSFSDNYNDLARERGVFENLRGLTRLAALAKGLFHIDRMVPLDFFLDSYVIEKQPTRDTVDLLTAVDAELNFQITGGVQLMALSIRLKKGDVTALRDLVLRARPEPASLFWRFVITRTGEIAIDNYTEYESDEAGALMAHAAFLLEQRRYEDALSVYERIEEKAPEMKSTAVLGQAIAMRRRGLEAATLTDMSKFLRKALSLFEKCVRMDSSLAECHYEFGVTTNAAGNPADAIQHYKNALKENPRFFPAHLGLGFVYYRLERDSAAKAHFDEYLKVDSSSEFAANARAIRDKIKVVH